MDSARDDLFSTKVGARSARLSTIGLVPIARWSLTTNVAQGAGLPATAALAKPRTVKGKPDAIIPVCWISSPTGNPQFYLVVIESALYYLTRQ